MTISLKFINDDNKNATHCDDSKLIPLKIKLSKKHVVANFVDIKIYKQVLMMIKLNFINFI